ncbi:Hemagglutinin-like protein [Rhodopirellula islandica]|uniref:Hemagglutinin-like protein n=1 Tax=Rhodopirellula islandica TaxID=595434 RepID=A0A0J1EPP0_RHOIS|nr:Hemagglutinin-like protein [Rhodopirellula islandica]
MLAGGILAHSDAGGGSQELDRSQIDRAIPALQRTVASIQASGSRDGSGIQTLDARGQGSGSVRPIEGFSSNSHPGSSSDQRGGLGQRDARQSNSGLQSLGNESRNNQSRSDLNRSGSLQSSSLTSADRSLASDSVQPIQSSTVVVVVQFVTTSPRPDNSVSVDSVLSGGSGRSSVGQGTVLVRANSSAAPSEQSVAGGSDGLKAAASDAVTADSGPVQQDQSTVEGAVDATAVAAATTTYERTNSTTEGSRIDLADSSASSAASDVDGGTIDWLPRVSSDDVSLDSSQADDSWELDEETLEHLREVARAASDKDADDVEATAARDAGESSLLEGHSVDDALATWFGSPTGLVDGIRFQGTLPTVVPTLSPGMVDIALDATVGVHRTVGLMASSETVSRPVAVDEVRDAVLAAIAFETDVLAQPALDSRPLRLSGLAYPGAAIVAGALALNARRRRDEMLLTSR